MNNSKLLAIGFPTFSIGDCGTLVSARPLESYDIIVINPVSALHLLTGDYSTIAYPQSGRFPRPVVVDDHIFRSWEIFNDSRVIEMASFLLRGGLLVFFLSPSVVITSADGGSNMGNYFWIDTLAPDGVSLGSDRKITHKANAGPLIITEDGKNSEFAPYLQKFNATAYATIEAGALADGFIPLAETKDRHCAAGHLPCGDHAGGIVFLPGPYQPALEAELVKCLESWSLQRDESDAEGQGKIRSLNDLIPELQPAAGGAKVVSTKSQAAAKSSSPKSSAGAKAGAAQDIIRQLEEQNAVAGEQKSLIDTLIEAAAAFEEADFIKICMAICEEQGLVCRANERCPNECTIVDSDQTEIIVRVVFQDARFEDYRSIKRELAALAESIIMLWSQAKTEPAGMLVLAQGKMLASNRTTDGVKDDDTFDRIADKYRISLISADIFIDGLDHWAFAPAGKKPSLSQAFEL